MTGTTIPIEPDTRDRLRGEKVGNETYTEVIDRLLDHQESCLLVELDADKIGELRDEFGELAEDS